MTAAINVISIEKEEGTSSSSSPYKNIKRGGGRPRRQVESRKPHFPSRSCTIGTTINRTWGSSSWPSRSSSWPSRSSLCSSKPWSSPPSTAHEDHPPWPQQGTSYYFVYLAFRFIPMIITILFTMMMTPSVDTSFVYFLNRVGENLND